MAKLDFSIINKSSAKSFNEQKSMIKRIGKGQTVLCVTCDKPLQLNVSNTNETGVKCSKGCTKVGLEVEGV
jgi:hypothetical protein